MTNLPDNLNAREIVIQTGVDVFMDRLASGGVEPGYGLVLEELREADAIRAVYRNLGSPAAAQSVETQPIASVSEVVGENEPLYGRNGTRI